MADDFAMGTTSAASSDLRGDVDMSHGDEPRLETAPAPAPAPASVTEEVAPSIPHFPLDADAEPSPQSSSQPTVIDSLAHKLSEQHLRRARTASASPPLSSHEAPILDDVPGLQPCPELEMEFLPSSCYPDDLQTSSASSSSSLPALPSGDIPIQPLSYARRPRPINTQLPPLLCPLSGGRSGTLEGLMDSMISTGDQCRVYQPPLSAQRPSTPTYIEVDPRFLGNCPDLEIDTEDILGPAWLGEIPSLRRASGPGGIRKSGAVPFPLSAEVALRCGNVVLSKPRMRRRKKTTRQHSTTSRGTSLISASPAPSSPAYPPPSSDLPMPPSPATSLPPVSAVSPLPPS